MTSRKDINIAISGGGLVGALNACYFGQHGYQVHLYEYRDDIRKAKRVQGRSINLALSNRGRESLRRVGLESKILDEIALPMYSRMIHQLNGMKKSIPYGKKDQCIYSVSRRLLNETLLSAAENLDNVEVHFGHKLRRCDINEKNLTFTVNRSEDVTVTPDLIVGCDGSFSTVRRAMMQQNGFDYTQKWIDHAYMELCMTSNEDGTHKMENDHLHIWPRGTFMLIALPNMDGSFTLTLFMPHRIFDELTSAVKVNAFFEKNFPDAVKIIGKNVLIEDFMETKASDLLYVKCSPHHYKDSIVLLGDAAHAMVPFYGQGMNCGFEDCLVFHEFMDLCNHDFGKVLSEYSNYRVPDTHAIVDLSMYNYLEMRDHVNSLSFIIRKKVDNFLNFMFPSIWIPLYATVAFSRTRYHKCIENRQWQDKIIKKMKQTTIMAVVAVAIFYGFRNQDKIVSRIHLITPLFNNMFLYLFNQGAK